MVTLTVVSAGALTFDAVNAAVARSAADFGVTSFESDRWDLNRHTVCLDVCQSLGCGYVLSGDDGMIFHDGALSGEQALRMAGVEA